MAIPRKDSALAAYAGNFSTRVSADPAAFGLTVAQAAAFGTASVAYQAAYDAVSVPGDRSISLTAAKDTAKRALLSIGRELYSRVQGDRSISDAQKVLVGVKIPKRTVTPSPVPAAAPGITAVEVQGRTVTLQFFDSTTIGRRGRMPQTSGLHLYSFVGDAPPAALDQWQYAGMTSKTRMQITFPTEVPGGSQAWFTAR